MKKLEFIIPMLLMVISFIACHQGTHTIIVRQTNDVKIRIEYSGAIMLTDDRTGIQALSHNAYINYDKNGDQLYIADDPHGKIVYEVNGDKTNALDNHGKALLADAIKIIAKQQVRQ